MQVRLQRFQAIEKGPDCGARISRILKAVGELADLVQRPASAFMLTLHHSDWVGDRAEGHRRQRLARVSARPYFARKGNSISSSFCMCASISARNVPKTSARRPRVSLSLEPWTES